MGRPKAEMHEHHHRDLSGGGLRAAVFGISDGLVSNAALILGVAGANPGPSFVRLAGLAGLLGGAFSMASGEYGSMRVQVELYERELESERRELARVPEAETRELAEVYESRGIDPEKAREMATEIMRDPEVALDVHAREELGISPDSLGRPIEAAASSFVSFGVGALVPLAPWFVIGGPAAAGASAALALLAAVIIGVLVSSATGRAWPRLVFRHLLLTVIPAVVTYGLGTAIGVTTS